MNFTNLQKSCSFFGHRNAKLTNQELKYLEKTIEKLILEKNVVHFLFGSRSNFDYICHKIVTELKVKYPNIQRKCYTCSSETCTLEKDRNYWEKIYSSTYQKKIQLLGVEEEVHYKTKYVSGKASYIERNQSMINDSDYCIFYYDTNYKPNLRKISKSSNNYYQPKSGTMLSYQYAKSKKKYIININKNQNAS